MKQFFLSLSSIFIMFSCKDADLHYLKEKYAFFDVETIVSPTGTKMIFSAEISNDGNEEIIDHGFFWGTSTNKNSTDFVFNNWINSATDEAQRLFLLEKGTTISLGKLEKTNQFTYETDVVLGRKYLVMAYIKTNKYVTYSKLTVIDESSVWHKKDTQIIPPNTTGYFCKNDKIYIADSGDRKIYELNVSSYNLVDKQNCPDLFNFFHFVIGDIAYFSHYYNGYNNMYDMWQYNTMTDRWTFITGKQEIPSSEPVVISFTQGQKGYSIFNDRNLQDYYIYEYEPKTNIWTQKNKSEITRGVRQSNLFYHKNRVYVYFNNKMWYFDENLATFQVKTNINFGSIHSIVTIDDNVYMILSKGNVWDIFKYDPENDNIDKLCTLYRSIYTNPIFVVAAKKKILFLPIGESHLYELDLSKLQ